MDKIKRKRHIVISAVLLAASLGLIALLVKALSLDPSKVASSQIGKPARDFSAAWLQGQNFISTASGDSLKLADLRGKPLILNFWASWCVSCRQEAFFFEQFWQRHKEQGIQVVGIAIQDTREQALDFAKQHGKTYPLVLDLDGRASIDYGVYGVPETFFIDRNGTIKHKEAGPVTVELLESYLPQIL